MDAQREHNIGPIKNSLFNIDSSTFFERYAFWNCKIVQKTLFYGRLWHAIGYKYFEYKPKLKTDAIDEFYMDLVIKVTIIHLSRTYDLVSFCIVFAGLSPT